MSPKNLCQLLVIFIKQQIHLVKLHYFLELVNINYYASDNRFHMAPALSKTR